MCHDQKGSLLELRQHLAHFGRTWQRAEIFEEAATQSATVPAALDASPASHKVQSGTLCYLRSHM